MGAQTFLKSPTYKKPWWINNISKFSIKQLVFPDSFPPPAPTQLSVAFFMIPSLLKAWAVRSSCCFLYWFFLLKIPLKQYLPWRLSLGYLFHVVPEANTLFPSGWPTVNTVLLTGKATRTISTRSLPPLPPPLKTSTCEEQPSRKKQRQTGTGHLYYRLPPFYT